MLICSGNGKQREESEGILQRFGKLREGKRENEQAEGGKGMGRFLAKELFKISLEQKIKQKTKYESRIIVFVLKMEKWI